MRHWSDYPVTEALPRDLTHFDPCLLQKLPPRLSAEALAKADRPLVTRTLRNPPPPLRGRAGEGGDAARDASGNARVAPPPPQPAPVKGAGAKAGAAAMPEPCV